MNNAFGPRRVAVLLAVTVVALADTLSVWSSAAASQPQAPPLVPASAAGAAGRANAPLLFEPNRGESTGAARFLAHGDHYTLFLAPTEAVMSVRDPASVALRGASTTGRQHASLPSVSPPSSVRGDVLHMRFDGANGNASITAEDPQPSTTNYLIGSDPNGWHTSVPNYTRVRYHDLYPGIDLVYHGMRGRPEYDFVLAPGADPAQIGLSFSGVSSIAIDRTGALIESLSDGGHIEQPSPAVYQVANGVKSPVRSGYRMIGRTGVGFTLGAHDLSQPVVIDPVIDYASYVSSEQTTGIAVDRNGDAYVVGDGGASDFPTTSGAFQTSVYDAESAVITKFNPQGSGVLYSTFIGGHTTTAAPSGRPAVDAAGNLYVAGIVTFASYCQIPSCADFPVTPGAFQTVFRGSSNSHFVVKLDPTGSRLVYSSYLGGSGFEKGPSVAVDTSGSAYVTGTTSSADFPTTPGAFQPHLGAPFATNAFITKINPRGSALVYSSYLGGSSEDIAAQVAVGSDGTAFVVGTTLSTDFPTTFGAFQTTCAGTPACTNFAGGGTITDAFVTRVSANGGSLVYSTYLGGGNAIQYGGNEFAFGIAVDASGFAYVTGYTDSIDFPVTSGAFHMRLSGLVDAFVTKLTPDGAHLAYSTYLGGPEQGCDGLDSEYSTGIAVDASGDAAVTGLECNDPNFPATSDAFQPTEPNATPRGPFTSDMNSWASLLNPDGSGLVWSGYLGGGGDDRGVGVAVDPSGNVYLAGITDSCDFPATPGAFQTALAGSLGGGTGPGGGYVVKVSAGVAESPATGVCPQPPVIPGASAGAVDPSFGSNGVVTTQIGAASEAEATLAQPDGRIVVGGTAIEPRTGLPEFAITRYLANGSVDKQFGVQGIAVSTFSGRGAHAHALAFNVDPLTSQPDGKILVGGNSLDNAGLSAYGLARYDSRGHLDPTFGSRGEVVTSTNGDGGILRGMAVQPDGRIVVVGYQASANSEGYFSATRYNNDGTLDQSFGSGGTVQVLFGPNQGASSDTIALQVDGKIVIGGTVYGVAFDGRNTVRFALARLLPGGQLDASFGATGEIETSYDTTFNGIRIEKNAYITGVAVQPDGRIVAGGYVAGDGYGFALARYMPDGSPDTSFGDRGTAESDFFGGGSSQTAMAIALQSDGKIDVAGSSNCAFLGVTGPCFDGTWQSDILVARYTSGGALDQTFGDGGWAETSMSGAVDEARAVAIQPDGGLIAAGAADEWQFFGPIRFGLVRYLTTGPASFELPATLSSPLLASFASPVANVTTANVTLSVRGSGPLNATVACADATGAAVSCVGGPVSTAALSPTTPLLAGQDYVARINPAGAPSPVLLSSTHVAIANETAQFRAAMSVEESGAGITDQWSKVSATSAYGGTYRTDHLNGASASYAFQGSSVTWYTVTGPDQGIADVYIDGGTATSVDLYSASTTYRVPETFSGLVSGAHTITITVTGQKDAAATDSLVAVDAFKVGTGAVVATPAATYAWSEVSAQGASGGTYAASDRAGSSLSFTFRGSSVTWETVLGPSMGTATMSIDGMPVHTFDCYAQSWSFGVGRTWPVSDGVHTVTITATGQRNSASTGTLVAVDSFSVS